jgi:hypothetical protein
MAIQSTPDMTGVTVIHQETGIRPGIAALHATVVNRRWIIYGSILL